MSYGGVPPPPAIQLVVFAFGSNEIGWSIASTTWP
jgi:hypothetical protein